MKLKFTTIVCLLFSVITLHAQVNAGELGLPRMGWWGGSPSSNTTSGVYYNDIWGYVDANGKEYAILGTPKTNYFLDVTDPLNISVVYSDTPGSTCIWRDFKTYGKYAYGVSEFGSEGLLVYDMSGLDSGGGISRVAQLNSTFAQAHNIFIDEANARLYVAGSATSGGTNYNILVYDLSNPASPTLFQTTFAQTQLSGGYIHDIFVKNNIAFASHGYNGLYVYDASNPTAWIEKSKYDASGGYNHSSWITEDDQFLIYAEEVPAGKPLVVLNVSNITNIFQETTFKEPLLAPDRTNVTPHNPFVRGNKVVISNYEDGTTIYDLAPLYSTNLVPQPPELEAYYDTYEINDNNNNYTGTEGNWGTYPFFPSGNIISSDINTGLYVLRPGIPLPIQLKSFNASPKNNREVLVAWSTSAEKNNDFFSIERSEDGTRFETIGKVKGAGTTGEQNDYTFIDGEL